MMRLDEQTRRNGSAGVMKRKRSLLGALEASGEVAAVSLPPVALAGLDAREERGGGCGLAS
jgi:hypothetical protein